MTYDIICSQKIIIDLSTFMIFGTQEMSKYGFCRQYSTTNKSWIWIGKYEK